MKEGTNNEPGMSPKEKIVAVALAGVLAGGLMEKGAQKAVGALEDMPTHTSINEISNDLNGGLGGSIALIDKTITKVQAEINLVGAKTSEDDSPESREVRSALDARLKALKDIKEQLIQLTTEK